MQRWGLLGLTAGLALAAHALATGASGAPLRSQQGHSGAAAAAPSEILTYDYGNTRSANAGPGPAIAGVSTAPAWNDDDLDGGVYGEPLVDGGTVYVATENDSIYAISLRTGAVRWKIHVGTAASLAVVDSAPTLSSGCGDINPLGITGTPVIDSARNELFVAEETLVGGANSWQDVRHWLVAVSLSSHSELWHRDIDPPEPNSPGTYYIPAEQQRPALTLAGGRLYVPFGGLDGDCGQYHGYLVSLAESGSGPLSSYEVPTSREGAIWETNGVLVGSDGELYVATGNGSSETATHFDEGDSLLELTPSLHRLGVWAPENWVELNANDWDLGSAGPIQIPGTTLVFVTGKPVGKGSVGYLLSEERLEGIGRGAFSGPVCAQGGSFGADASDLLGSGTRREILVFAPCADGTQALEVDPAAKTFRRDWSATGGPNGPPIVAGGVVWALNWESGELYGMRPASGRVLVERSTDALEHFATPSVADGLVLVPTASGVEAFQTISS